jgi:hypothetical protein
MNENITSWYTTFPLNMISDAIRPFPTFYLRPYSEVTTRHERYVTQAQITRYVPNSTQ